MPAPCSLADHAVGPQGHRGALEQRLRGTHQLPGSSRTTTCSRKTWGHNPGNDFSSQQLLGAFGTLGLGDARASAHLPQRAHRRGVPGEEVLGSRAVSWLNWDPALHQGVTVEEDGGGHRLCLIFSTLGGRGKHHIQVTISSKRHSSMNTMLRQRAEFTSPSSAKGLQRLKVRPVGPSSHVPEELFYRLLTHNIEPLP